MICRRGWLCIHGLCTGELTQIEKVEDKKREGYTRDEERMQGWEEETGGRRGERKKRRERGLGRRARVSRKRELSGEK